MDMSISAFSVTRSTSEQQQVCKKISVQSNNSSNLDDSWSILDDSDYFDSINYGILGENETRAS